MFHVKHPSRILAKPRAELAKASGRESASIPSKTLSPRAYKNRHSDRAAAFNPFRASSAKSLIDRKGDSGERTDLQQPHVHIRARSFLIPLPDQGEVRCGYPWIA